MTSKEKIEYMLNKIREVARISPSGYFYVDCSPLVDIEKNGGIPDEAPVLISQMEQVSLLKKFQKDNLIFSIEFDKDYKKALIALMDLEIENDDNPYLYKNKKKKVNENEIKVSVRGGLLYVNERTGSIKLNKVEKILNIKSREFKIILVLIKSKNYQATYKELLGGVEESKSRIRALGFSMRNIKEALGILPQKTSKNKDIIKNIKGYGYKLLTKKQAQS